MALPKLIRRLFENNGFGTKLSKDIIPDLDATNITSGKFTKARMPDFTTCTVKHVATAEEQVTLTVEDVQNGDIVVVAQDLVYLVQDDTKLNDISYG
jgi:Cu/Ag efflux protein CusF